MTSNVTLEQVEQLAVQLPVIDRLKLLARISDQLSRLGTAEMPSDAESARWEREAMADALLQELDAIAESIDGEFDSAADIRQIREERADQL